VAGKWGLIEQYYFVCGWDIIVPTLWQVLRGEAEGKDLGLDHLYQTVEACE